RPIVLEQALDRAKNLMKRESTQKVEQELSFIQAVSYEFQNPVASQGPVAESPPLPKMNLSSGGVREERVVKEYLPEKRESQHIQPLLTEMISIAGDVYFRGSDTGCR